MPLWELQAGSRGNRRQAHIVLPTAPHVRSRRLRLIHATGLDFAQLANREQKSRDVQVIGVSRHGLTTSSPEIQPAQSLSSFSGIGVPRNSFAPRLGATLAPSGGNAKLWQKPLRQDYVADKECHSPNPIRHFHTLPICRLQVYAGRSSSGTSW